LNKYKGKMGFFENMKDNLALEKSVSSLEEIIDILLMN